MAAAFIIFLATLENMWPFITGSFHTPAGYVFLGTVHHPPDYFYYLSQFALGKYRIITSIDLFTAEHVPATFVGWTNVLLGKLFFLFGFSPFIAYHTSVLLCTVLLLYLSYRLAGRLIPATKTLSLYLFVLFHAFSVMRDGSPSYGDYYTNFAVPRVRLGGVPHQLILHAASLGIILLYTRVRTGRMRISNAVLLAFVSIILASLQPVLWTLLFSVLILTEFLSHLSDRTNLRHAINALLLVSLPSVPVLFSLHTLFTTLPFSQLRAWEALQQTPLTIEHFVSATGPIFLLSLLFLPGFVRKRSWERIFVSSFAALSYILFLSPIPNVLDISHVRFMSTLAILCVSIIASDGISQLRHIGPRIRNIPLLSTALLIVLTVYLVPNHKKTLTLVSGFSPQNAFHYLPRDTYDTLITAGKVMKPEDVALVTWPYNETFPALTGHRSYDGHPLLTIRAEEKTQNSEAFFSSHLSIDQAQTLLSENDITYVIARQDSPIRTFPFLRAVFSDAEITLYRVVTH